MADDFSRITFVPQKRFSAVLMQQGRVQLDADWNEQLAIQKHLERTAARDVIGPCGVPLDGDGFALSAAGRDLLIAPGRIYVDGILVEFEPEPVPFTLVANSSPEQLAVTIWNPDGRDFAVNQQVVAHDLADASKLPLTFTLSAADAAAGVVTLSPAGAGDTLKSFAMPRLRRSASYLVQPDYRAPPILPPTAGSSPISTSGNGM